MWQRLLKLLEKPPVVSVLFGIACAVVVIGMREAGWLQSFELLAYDAFVRERAAAGKPSPRIALVVATEADLERLDWPVADGAVADLAGAILKQEPRAVGLDIYRDRPRDPGADKLAALFAKERRVYPVMKFEEPGKRAIGPPPALAGRPDRVGFADIVEDFDGVVRKGLLYLDDGKTVYSSLALQLALRYLAAEGVKPARGEPNPEHLRLGRATLRPLEPEDGGYVRADAAGYQFLLDFHGGRAPFPAHSFSDVLDGKIAPDALRGRMVLIGVATKSVKDFFASPFREGEGAVEPMHGVALHAHAADQLVRMALGETPQMHALTAGWELLWILFWCGAGTGAIMKRGFPYFAAITLGGLLILGGACYFAFHGYLWLPLLPPALGFVLSASLVTAWLTRHESGQRKILMQIFSRYVSQPLADDLWTRRTELLEGGRLKPRRLAATVLFSDVKGFTSISEKLDPQQLMDWLSEYLGAMAGIVHAHGGIVDKFIGDAVMAVFGLHAERTHDHAKAAVDCAIAMRVALVALNKQWNARGLPSIGCRIGIHTGTLAYGTVGSGEKLESTVIGDTVNMASRLESLKQEEGSHKIDPVDPEEPDAPVRILISDATYSQLTGNYKYWLVGPVELKGKTEAINVFGVRGTG